MSVQFVGRSFAEAALFQIAPRMRMWPVPTKASTHRYPPGNGCIRKREGHGHAFSRHLVCPPYTVQGHAFDERLRAEIRHIAGVPARTATDSIFAAWHALGA